MSFTFKGGQSVPPGEELRVPIPATGASVLDVEWSSEGGLDLHFLVEFTQGGPSASETQSLHDEEHCVGNKALTDLEVASPGTCCLVWKNCYVGWLGGTVRKVSYTVSLMSLEERRLREEAQRQRQAALEEEERLRAEAADRARRLVSIQDEIQSGEQILGSTRQAVSEQQASVTAQKREVELLRQKLLASETELAASEELLQTRERELDEAAKQLTGLQSEKAELEALQASSTHEDAAKEEVMEVNINEEGPEKYAEKLEQRSAAIWEAKVKAAEYFDGSGACGAAAAAATAPPGVEQAAVAGA